MDKVELEYKIPESRKIEYNGVTIEVTPFISGGQQTALINNYLNDYFGKNPDPLVPGSTHNYLEAEYKLINYIFQGFTNINAENFDENIYADIGLFEKIISEISNYADFRKKLDYIVADVKEQMALDSSVGAALSYLVAKVSMFLDKTADMNPEDLEKMQAQGLELITRLEKTSVLGTPPKIAQEDAETKESK